MSFFILRGFLIFYLYKKSVNDLFFRFVLYTLHSNMQSTDQKRVFKVPPPGVRKVVCLIKFIGSLNILKVKYFYTM